MQTKTLWRLVTFLAIFAMVISACGQGANPPPAQPAEPQQTQAPAS